MSYRQSECRSSLSQSTKSQTRGKYEKSAISLTTKFCLSVIFSRNMIQTYPSHVLEAGLHVVSSVSAYLQEEDLQRSLYEIQQLRFLANVNQCQFHYLYKAVTNVYQLKIWLILPCSASSKHPVYLHFNAKHPIKAFILTQVGCVSERES